MPKDSGDASIYKVGAQAYGFDMVGRQHACLPLEPSDTAEQSDKPSSSATGSTAFTPPSSDNDPSEYCMSRENNTTCSSCSSITTDMLDDFQVHVWTKGFKAGAGAVAFEKYVMEKEIAQLKAQMAEMADKMVEAGVRVDKYSEKEVDVLILKAERAHYDALDRIAHKDLIRDGGPVAQRLAKRSDRLMYAAENAAAHYQWRQDRKKE